MHVAEKGQRTDRSKHGWREQWPQAKERAETGPSWREAAGSTAKMVQPSCPGADEF